jgi:hypothetical protein
VLVALQTNVLPTIKDPITFTCAAIAAAEVGVTDRLASPESVARAVPFRRRDASALPPSYFHLLHQVQNVRRRQVPA